MHTHVFFIVSSVESLNHEMSAYERYSEPGMVHVVSLTRPGQTLLVNLSTVLKLSVYLSILPNSRYLIFCVWDKNLLYKDFIWGPKANSKSQRDSVALPRSPSWSVPGQKVPALLSCWAQGFPRLCPVIVCHLRPRSSDQHPAIAHQLTPHQPPMDREIVYQTPDPF